MADGDCLREPLRQSHPAGDHESRLAELGLRKAQGSYYTPPDVVAGLLRLTLDPLLGETETRGGEAVAKLRILDPTCGTGNFVLAAFERVRVSLLRCGFSTGEAAVRAVHCVVGVDLDPDAVEICRSVLALAVGAALEDQILIRHIVCADSLVMAQHAPVVQSMLDEPGVDWETLMANVGASEGFDLVIGNPPFLNQLQTETAFVGPNLENVKSRFPDAARGYVDPASLFLLVGLDVLKKQHGRLCLVEPLAVLATRGAAFIRKSLLLNAALTDVWFAEAKVFDAAAVEVWAPVLRTGAERQPVALHCGREFERVGSVAAPAGDADSWGSLLAFRRGVPAREWATRGTLADIATATADFRDQYYGLAGHVVDDLEGVGERPKLITSGLIDPARLLWGQRPTTFNRQRFIAPRVELSELSDALQAWARKRLVPKVLVATQTRVLEPIVDTDGSLLPSVPVVSVETSGETLWRVAALLASPPIAAIAAARHFGAALSAEALKLSARDMLALPLPTDVEAWGRAAQAFEQATTAPSQGERYALLRDSGLAMCDAYGVGGDDALMHWWAQRLPKGTRVAGDYGNSGY